MGEFQIIKYSVLIPGLIIFICFSLVMWLNMIISVISKKWNLESNLVYYSLSIAVFFISLYWLKVADLFFADASVMSKAKTLVIVFSLTFLGFLVLLLEIVCLYIYCGTFYYFILQYFYLIMFRHLFVIRPLLSMSFFWWKVQKDSWCRELFFLLCTPPIHIMLAWKQPYFFESFTVVPAV